MNSDRRPPTAELVRVDHYTVVQWLEPGVGAMVQLTNERTGNALSLTSDQWHRIVKRAAELEGIAEREPDQSWRGQQCEARDRNGVRCRWPRPCPDHDDERGSGLR